MTSQTTDEQVSEMRAMCAKLTANSAVKAAHVDDWGCFGNFTVMVVPTEPGRHTTRALKSIVSKALPKGAHLRECFPPDTVKERNFDGRTRVIGYARSNWTFDVDYQHYDASSNSFTT